MSVEHGDDLSGSGERQNPAVTAQDLFKHLIRDLIGPGLRSMGFRGSYTRTFWIERGDYASHLWTQKNRYSTRTEVDFSIYLDALHVPTQTVYWYRSLNGLIPEMTDSEWTIEAGSPPEPVAESVLDGIRRYGWPAMQAALDSPGFPPDPEAEWARTFAQAGDSDRDDGPLDLDEIAPVLRPAGEPADDWFAKLADQSPAGRIAALRMIGENAPDDPRRRAVLSDRAERDPSRHVRKYARDLLVSPWGAPEEDQPPALDAIAWVLQKTGQPSDKWFAKLASEDSGTRRHGMQMIAEEAADDPRVLPVLLDRLERDPSPRARSYAAHLLGRRTGDQTVRQALRDAAAQDEDIQARWAARYAIRLADTERA